MRHSMRVVVVVAGIVGCGGPGGGTVTVDGVPVPKATSAMNVEASVIEVREGGNDSCPRLTAGRCPTLSVCVVSPAAVPALDQQLVESPVKRVAVGVEDGRQFLRCLPERATARGGGNHRYRYCLRCEEMKLASP